MPYALYVCLQDDDRVAVFALDGGSGRLTPLRPGAGGGRPAAFGPGNASW